MLTFFVGIVVGWLVPRPRWLAPIENAVFGKIKEKVPSWAQWW